MSWDQIRGHVSRTLNGSQIEPFRQMVEGYFRQQSDGKTWKQRPPLGFRLPHGDYFFVVKPSVQRDRPLVNEIVNDRECLVNGKEVVTVVPDKMTIEALRVEGRLKANAMTIRLEPGLHKPTRWGHWFGIDALDNLVEMVNFFVLVGPETVFAKNSDHCSVCGKGLTDQLSRDRGIGPECLGYVSTWLDRPLSRITPGSERPMSQYRSIDDV
jgi:hypothetical protein